MGEGTDNSDNRSVEQGSESQGGGEQSSLRGSVDLTSSQDSALATSSARADNSNTERSLPSLGINGAEGGDMKPLTQSNSNAMAGKPENMGQPTPPPADAQSQLDSGLSRDSVSGLYGGSQLGDIAGGGGARSVGGGQAGDTGSSNLGTSGDQQRAPGGPVADSRSDQNSPRDGAAEKGANGGDEGASDQASSDKTLTSNQSDLIFPKSAEELQNMSREQMENLYAENQKNLDDKIAANHDKLPAAIGFHGGTRESQDLWFGSKGQQMVPPGEREGRGTNKTWVGGVTQKSDDPQVLATDMGQAAAVASNFAAPRHIHDAYTPGSVAVLDLSPSIEKGKSGLTDGGEFQTNQGTNKLPPETPVDGYASTQNFHIGGLSTSTLHNNFDQMAVGAIQHGEYAHFDAANETYDRNSFDGFRKSQFTEGLRRQYFTDRAVDMFIQRSKNPPHA